MAYVPAISPFGASTSSSNLVFEEFVPPSAWTEDATCHYLLVDLPGFKRQELKLQVDNRTHILVSGERHVRDNKYIRFEKSFELPKTADREKISGKLDGEILYITVPKKGEQEHQEIKHGSSHGVKDTFDPTPTPTPTSTPSPTPTPTPTPTQQLPSASDVVEDDNNKKSDAYESDKKVNEIGLEIRKHRRGSNEDWGHDADLFLRSAIEKLKKNKSIVVTAILAFSLGMLVTQKFQSDER